MKSLLREPLLHFAVLGAACFIAYRVVSGPPTSDAGRILITEAEIAAMHRDFTRTWQRPPSSDELEGLIQDRVREEVYYREAIALRLDQDDAIIRRRLRQKLEFITDDVADLPEPDEATLRSFYESHGELFRVDPRFSFRQVYLNPERHGGRLNEDAVQLLAQLRTAGTNADLSNVGDPLLMEHEFTAVPAGLISREMGQSFALKLGELLPGQWEGPIQSGYGAHLVFLGERIESVVPPLDDVRDAVRREWESARRLEASERFYRGLLQRYSVTIQRPAATNSLHQLAKAPQ